MKLPFTTEQFLQLFRDYNTTFFPVQILFYLLACAVIFFSVKRTHHADQIINGFLGFFWLWMGIAYHLLFFTAINKAAYAFGGIFILQGLLFFYYGVVKQKLSYHFTPSISGVLGVILVTFALAIYPLLGHSFGQVYPEVPTFGLPCPTTIFTFGILLWSERTFPKIILVIPLGWSLLGFSAALTLGIKQDIALVIAGILATVVLLFQKQMIAATQH